MLCIQPQERTNDSYAVIRTNLTDTEESNVNEAGGYVLRDSIPVKYETGEPHLSCDESGGRLSSGG